MLENGIDPNICNDDGLTALHQVKILMYCTMPIDKSTFDYFDHQATSSNGFGNS
jgi:hypothetical protein